MMSGGGGEPPSLFEEPTREFFPGQPRAADGEVSSPVHDPWAHRRGEPRTFAFLWSVFVLVAVSGSILWLARLPAITPSSYSPAARTLLVVLAMGVTVLWPMVRLSQETPESDPAGAALADLLVTQLPVQMVVWPMAVLASWPTRTVAAVSAMFIMWGVLTGGVLALAMSRGWPRGPGPLARAGWMLVLVGLVLGGPLVATVLAWAGRPGPGWISMSSPFTGIFEIGGHGWSGPTTPVRLPQWVAIWIVGLAGVGCWMAAAWMASAGSRRAGGIH